MLDPRQELAELDRLERKANALRRSLNGLRTGTRNVTVLAAELADELAELRGRHAQPEQEAQHDPTEEAQVVVRH